MRRLFISALIVLSGFSPAAADPDRLLESLNPSGYVSDFAGVMQPADRAAVERLLTELEQKTGAQVAVVTLKSLEGGPIDDFASRLFERWGIGQKGKDNGLLLIAAIEDRKVRIETGYGFEGVLPDAAAGRLIDQYVLPAFRKGDYSSGLRSGTAALAAVAASAAGVELSGVPGESNYHRYGKTIPDFIAVFLLMLLVIGPMVFMFFAPPGSRYRRPGGIYYGGSGGFGGGFRGGGFGGFGGGLSGGGGASRGW